MSSGSSEFTECIGVRSVDRRVHSRSLACALAVAELTGSMG